MRIKDVSLKIKIGGAIAAIIILALIFGLYSWGNTKTVQGMLGEIALWGDIDMVMNEDVIQNAILLDSRYAEYRLNADPSQLKALNNQYTATEQGLDSWYEMVKNDPALNKVVQDTRGYLKRLRSAIDVYTTSREATAVTFSEWDALVQACLSFLNHTMEEVIDPAKEQAEQAGNIEEMVRWGAIDMVMNEGVIANVLKLQTASHDYAAAFEDRHKEKYLTSLQDAQAGLAEWRSTLSGSKEMESAADRITAHLADYTQKGESVQTEVGKMLSAEHDMGSALQALLAGLESAMEQTIDPAKEAKFQTIQELQQQIRRYTLIFIVLGGLAAIVLAILLTRAITRPILSTIDNVNDVATGDLTNKVPVYAKDEMGGLAKTLNSMTDKLESMVRGVQGS